MAKSPSSFKLIGIVLLLAGAGLTLWGFQASGSFESQLSTAISGTDDKVMTLYISGAISFVIGFYLYFKK